MLRRVKSSHPAREPVPHRLRCSMLYSPCRVLLVDLVCFGSLHGKLFFFTSVARIGKPCDIWSRWLKRKLSEGQNKQGTPPRRGCVTPSPQNSPLKRRA